jgi:hypothetical protein
MTAHLKHGVRLVVAICLIKCVSGRAEEGDALLKRVTAAHRAAREAITTVDARYVCEGIVPEKAVLDSGRYIRTPNAVRVLQGQEGKSSFDILVSAGESRMVSRQWSTGKTRFDASRASSAQTIGLCDVWHGLLFTFFARENQPVTFERFVEFASEPPQVRQEQIDGREVIHVRVAIENASKRNLFSFEFDQGKNYLVRRVKFWREGADGHSEAEINEFVEARPGVFLPLKCHRKSFWQGKLVNESIVSIKDQKVNEPVDERLLLLPPIPSGTVVHDRARELKYKIDTNWKQIGTSTPSPIYKIGGPHDETRFDGPSQSEPTKKTHWVFLISALLIVGGGVLWLLQRWRSNRQTS